MGKLDFMVMVVFALLIFAIGLTFTKSSSKNGQAFFEAGGETPWWINGLSLFISYFSAGTFVVWGSIAYSSGLVANVIQLTMAISGLIVTLVIASRWKKKGVATAAEFIGKRFGGVMQSSDMLIQAGHGISYQAFAVMRPPMCIQINEKAWAVLFLQRPQYALYKVKRYTGIISSSL